MSDGVEGAGKRLLSLETPLGRDVLQPVAFHAEEELTGPYAVTVETVCDQASVDSDQLLYQPACLEIVHGESESRVLHGIVRSFAASGEPQRGRYAYALTFVPKLWFMGQTSDCRIFANKSAADILTTLCNENGQTLQLKIYGDKPVLPYVTQYNETDLAFASRLIEAAGYFYFFEHSADDHVLVVTNQTQGFPQGEKPAMSVAHEGGGTRVLTHWRKLGATAHGKFWLRDYDPLKPSTPPDGQQPTHLKTAGAPKRDVFAWPALAATPSDASGRARIMMEAAEAEAALMEAGGANPLLAPGSRFTLARDPYDESQDVEYIVRSVSSSGHDQSWLGGDAGAGYGNHLTVFKAATTWREKLLTPRPAMSGLYSAIVLGKDGEEIHADEYGRVKVRFPWDHRSDATADNAIWVRVVQPWAGKEWGWQHLPRVGTEVAVAFLDGDPDRPVVIGGLFNAEAMPPFPLTSQQTKSGFRSRSTKNGGSANYSELSFDDDKGNEKILLHAEKDLTVETENDQTVTVGHDRSLTVKHQETIEIDDSQTVTIKNGRTTTVSASGDTLTVENGGITITAKANDIAVAANLGSVTVTGLQSVALKVGENSLTVDQQGVHVSGLKVDLQGQTMVQVSGPMTQVTGDGMLTLKGGVMMLN